jgi:hypothetical protein
VAIRQVARARHTRVMTASLVPTTTASMTAYGCAVIPSNRVSASLVGLVTTPVISKDSGVTISATPVHPRRVRSNGPRRRGPRHVHHPPVVASHTTKPIIVALRGARRNASMQGRQNATVETSVTTTRAALVVVVLRPRKATVPSVVDTNAWATHTMEQTSAKMASVKTVGPPIATIQTIPVGTVPALLNSVDKISVV